MTQHTITAQRIVRDIIRELIEDRQGFDEWWDGILTNSVEGPELQQEIVEKLESIVDSWYPSSRLMRVVNCLHAEADEIERDIKQLEKE